jgi:hypothetical protein
MTPQNFKPKGKDYFEQNINLLNEVLQQQIRTQTVLLALGSQINSMKASIEEIELESVEKEFISLVNHWEKIIFEESKSRLSSIEDLFKE